MRLIIGLYISAELARYLGPTSFGILNYSISVALIFSAFTDLGIENFAVTDFIRKSPPINVIIGTVFRVKFFLGLFASIFTAVFVVLIEGGIELSSKISIIIAISLLFYSFNIFDYWFQSLVKSKYVVYSRLSAYLICAGSKLVLIFLKKPLIYFAFIYTMEFAISGILLFYFYYYSSKQKMNWSFSWPYGMELLKNGAPLLISGLAVVLIMNIDKVMLRVMVNHKEVGIYSVGANLSMMFYFLPVIIGSTFMPRLVQNWERSREVFYELVLAIMRILSALGVIIVVITFLLSEKFIIMLFGVEYIESSSILIFHVVGFLFVSHVSIRNRVLIIAGHTNIIAIFSATTVVLNIILNFVLIPTYSASGAVIASVASWALTVVILPLLFKSFRRYPVLFLKSFFFKS